MVRGTAVLIGGPFAGQTVGFSHQVVVMAEPVVIHKPEFRTHTYRITELVRGVFVGQHESLAIGIESLTAELLRGYCAAHAPKDTRADAKQFMSGFDTGLALMMAANASRNSAVCDN